MPKVRSVLVQIHTLVVHQPIFDFQVSQILEQRSIAVYSTIPYSFEDVIQIMEIHVLQALEWAAERGGTRRQSDSGIDDVSIQVYTVKASNAVELAIRKRNGVLGIALNMGSLGARAAGVVE
jgi:hypothetical protein